MIHSCHYQIIVSIWALSYSRILNGIDILKKQLLVATNSILGLLRRNIKVASTYVKDLAYRALIRPKLEYASVVWSPWQQFLVDNIEKVQRRSARYVLNDYR